MLGDYLNLSHRQQGTATTNAGASRIPSYLLHALPLGAATLSAEEAAQWIRDQISTRDYWYASIPSILHLAVWLDLEVEGEETAMSVRGEEFIETVAPNSFFVMRRLVELTTIRSRNLHPKAKSDGRINATTTATTTGAQQHNEWRTADPAHVLLYGLEIPCSVQQGTPCGRTLDAAFAPRKNGTGGHVKPFLEDLPGSGCSADQLCWQWLAPAQYARWLAATHSRSSGSPPPLQAADTNEKKNRRKIVADALSSFLSQQVKRLLFSRDTDGTSNERGAQAEVEKEEAARGRGAVHTDRKKVSAISQCLAESVPMLPNGMPSFAPEGYLKRSIVNSLLEDLDLLADSPSATLLLDAVCSKLLRLCSETLIGDEKETTRTSVDEHLVADDQQPSEQLPEAISSLFETQQPPSLPLAVSLTAGTDTDPLATILSRHTRLSQAAQAAVPPARWTAYGSNLALSCRTMYKKQSSVTSSASDAEERSTPGDLLNLELSHWAESAVLRYNRKSGFSDDGTASNLLELEDSRAASKAELEAQEQSISNSSPMIEMILLPNSDNFYDNSRPTAPAPTSSDGEKNKKLSWQALLLLFLPGQQQEHMLLLEECVVTNTALLTKLVASAEATTNSTTVTLADRALASLYWGSHETTLKFSSLHDIWFNAILSHRSEGHAVVGAVREHVSPETMPTQFPSRVITCYSLVPLIRYCAHATMHEGRLHNVRQLRQDVIALIEAFSTDISVTHLVAACEQYGARNDLQHLVSRSGKTTSSGEDDEEVRVLLSDAQDPVVVAKYLLHTGSSFAMDTLCPLTGESPTTMALQYGHPSLVRFLVSLRPNPNKANFFGLTPLMVASVLGLETAVIPLLQSPVCLVDKQGPGGMTALHLALIFGENPKLALYLVREGKARIDIADHNGLTPILAASYFAQPSAYPLLVQGGIIHGGVERPSTAKERRTKEELAAHQESEEEVRSSSGSKSPSDGLPLTSRSAIKFQNLATLLHTIAQHMTYYAMDEEEEIIDYNHGPKAQHHAGADQQQRPESKLCSDTVSTPEPPSRKQEDKRRRQLMSKRRFVGSSNTELLFTDTDVSSVEPPETPSQVVADEIAFASENYTRETYEALINVVLPPKQEGMLYPCPIESSFSKKGVEEAAAQPVTVPRAILDKGYQSPKRVGWREGNGDTDSTRTKTQSGGRMVHVQPSLPLDEDRYSGKPVEERGISPPPSSDYHTALRRRTFVHLYGMLKEQQDILRLVFTRQLRSLSHSAVSDSHQRRVELPSHLLAREEVVQNCCLATLAAWEDCLQRVDLHIQRLANSLGALALLECSTTEVVLLWELLRPAVNAAHRVLALWMAPSLTSLEVPGGALDNNRCDDCWLECCYQYRARAQGKRSQAETSGQVCLAVVVEDLLDQLAEQTDYVLLRKPLKEQLPPSERTEEEERECSRHELYALRCRRVIKDLLDPSQTGFVTLWEYNAAVKFILSSPSHPKTDADARNRNTAGQEQRRPTAIMPTEEGLDALCQIAMTGSLLFEAPLCICESILLKQQEENDFPSEERVGRPGGSDGEYKIPVVRPLMRTLGWKKGPVRQLRKSDNLPYQYLVSVGLLDSSAAVAGGDDAATTVSAVSLFYTGTKSLSAVDGKSVVSFLSPVPSVPLRRPSSAALALRRPRPPPSKPTWSKKEPIRKTPDCGEEEKERLPTPAAALDNKKDTPAIADGGTFAGWSVWRRRYNNTDGGGGGGPSAIDIGSPKCVRGAVSLLNEDLLSSYPNLRVPVGQRF